MCRIKTAHDADFEYAREALQPEVGRAVSMGVVSVQKGSEGNHSRIRGKGRESLVFTEVWPRAGADKRE